MKICVTAAPEKGKANTAVEAVLAKALGLPMERIGIVAGYASPRKTVEIDGLDEDEVRRRLSVLSAPTPLSSPPSRGRGKGL